MKIEKTNKQIRACNHGDGGSSPTRSEQALSEGTEGTHFLEWEVQPGELGV